MRLVSGLAAGVRRRPVRAGDDARHGAAADREPAGHDERIHLPDASERSEDDARHVQHLRHDARGGRSDGDGRLRADALDRAARGEGRAEDEVPHRGPSSPDRRTRHRIRRGPRSPLPLLHRQPRHDAVLPRASDARQGRLVHARTRPSGRGPVHAVQRLHAGRRRTAADRDAAHDRGLRRRHRRVVAQPEARHRADESRQRRQRGAAGSNPASSSPAKKPTCRFISRTRSQASR